MHGGPQVLAEREQIHVRGAQVVHGLRRSLRRSHRGPSIRLVLVSTVGLVLLGVREHGEGLLVARARIAHRMRQPLHRLDVLREHFEARIHHGLDVAQHALEIRRQRFDGDVRRAPLDGANRSGVVRGAAIRQVVAIHRGEHDVLELHELDAARGVLGLLRVEPAARIAGVHASRNGRRACTPRPST